MSKHTPPTDKAILEWSAPQHAHYERGKIWYAISAIVVVLLIAHSVWTEAWTFTFIIVLMTGLYAWVHKEKPSNKRFRIWKHGFALEDEFIEWKECKGYWILKMNDYSELHLEKAKGGDIKIQTNGVSPYLVQETLAPLVPELEDKKEGILDTIIRICKL